MPPVDRNAPKRAKSSDSQLSLMEFMREYPDDAACLEHLWRLRYSPDGTHAECPKCECERPFKRYRTKQGRQSWTCTGCGHHVHPTAGTIFHKSSTSLHLWFYAMYLCASTRCGISAKQLERELGVSYRTAWRMLNKIRNELMSGDGEVLSGEVEVDETYVGGRMRGQQRHPGRPRADENKTPVFGMAQRGGKIVATVTPDTKARTLEPHIQRHVLPIVYTDEYHSYYNLGKRAISTTASPTRRRST
jgi:transposase